VGANFPEASRPDLPADYKRRENRRLPAHRLTMCVPRTLRGQVGSTTLTLRGDHFSHFPVTRFHSRYWNTIPFHGQVSLRSVLSLHLWCFLLDVFRFLRLHDYRFASAWWVKHYGPLFRAVWANPPVIVLLVVCL
jgi:hypothetical protein